MDDLKASEQRALHLATDRNALSELRQKVSAAAASGALFNTDRFRREIETAYVAMWERHLTGKAPETFRV